MSYSSKDLKSYSDNNRSLVFRLNNSHAKYPTKGTVKSAGYDLYSVSDYTLIPHKTILIDVGIDIFLPENCYSDVRPRSSLSLNNAWVALGTVDEDYSGKNLKVIIANISNEIYKIKRGQRVAQLIIQNNVNLKVVNEKLEPISNNNEERTGGFGSTGK